MRAITPSLVPKLKSFLFIDGYEPCVYEAAAKIVTMVIAEEGHEGKDWVVLLVGGVGTRDQKGQSKMKIGDAMIMPIFVYLLKHDALAVHFLRSGGIKIIQQLLTQYSTDLQVSYYTILGLWLLSYVEESYQYFNDPSVINR
jgi:V-type H+-transporting ATPase subunit H